MTTRKSSGRAAAKPRKGGKASTPAADAPLILVVDDYEDNRSLYTRFLAYSGMRVAEAADGHEALAKARELHPDVIVMDLSLPGLDGWEATRILKKDPATAGATVIALTGHALHGHSEGALAAGCDVFLTKPCLPDQLLAEVGRVLQQRAKRGTGR
jgi:two-component system cell cycle response regulator DivK